MIDQQTAMRRDAQAYEDKMKRLDKAIDRANAAIRIAEAFLFLEVGIAVGVVIALVVR